MFLSESAKPKPQLKEKISRALLTVFLGMFVSIGLNAGMFSSAIISPLGDSKEKIEKTVKKKQYEVFGFAPYWTINKLDNVDFKTLTTLAYFGVPVNSDGTFDEENIGFKTLNGEKAKRLFDKAQSYGTRVVLTLTQMDNDTIEGLMINDRAQDLAIEKTVKLVREKNMDGVNIDFEYVGNPGPEMRNKFTGFVAKMTEKLHSRIPNSKVTVSVYAASAKDPKMYDIAGIAAKSDGIFMMAYDFATRASDHAIPTAPLHGHREGKYWYDISTAVDDFLKVMPADKLILGLPWYGYNYAVTEPGVKVERYKGYYYSYWLKRRKYTAFQPVSSAAQTYANAQTNAPQMSGWDEYGKVGWHAYKEDGVWRMIFLDDVRSLKIKYDFAKEKKLAGVGMWALGFDAGTTEMWDLLSREFGGQIADNRSARN